MALILKKTLLRGPTPPFVMELPSYKRPAPGLVLYRMAERGWAFIRRAGTLIVAVSIVVWAALYYPHNAEQVEAPFRARQESLETRLAALPEESPERDVLQAELDGIPNQILGAYNRQSILGQMGRAIEPVVRPLGWDWRIGCAVIASFPAREVVVATLGVIYDLGEEVADDEEQGQNRLQTALKQAMWDSSGKPVFNIPVALSIMVFFAPVPQCASTLGDHQTRDQQLGLASVYVRIHDGAGLSGRPGHVSARHVAFCIRTTGDALRLARSGGACNRCLGGHLLAAASVAPGATPAEWRLWRLLELPDEAGLAEAGFADDCPTSELARAAVSRLNADSVGISSKPASCLTAGKRSA